MKAQTMETLLRDEGAKKILIAILPILLMLIFPTALLILTYQLIMKISFDNLKHFRLQEGKLRQMDAYCLHAQRYQGANRLLYSGFFSLPQCK